MLGRGKKSSSGRKEDYSIEQFKDDTQKAKVNFLTNVGGLKDKIFNFFGAVPASAEEEQFIPRRQSKSSLSV